MQREEAIKTLDELLIEANSLAEYKQDNNPDYDKWHRKIKRAVEKVFGQSGDHLKELEKTKFEANTVAQAMDNVYNSNGEKNKFNKSIIDKKSLLESFIEEVEDWDEHTSKAYSIKTFDNTTVNIINTLDNTPKTKVFIVHGHDNGAKQEVARFIEKLGFEPIILHEQVSAQMTIIEKIEAYAEEADFGVVIYTECDQGGKDNDSLRPRARQNVVFEHGYLIGLLGRENVCPLVKGSVEKPGDIGGIVYTAMDDNSSWHLPLAKELKRAGYDVDATKLF